MSTAEEAGILVSRKPYLVDRMAVAPELEDIQKHFPISKEDRNRLKDSMAREGQKDPVRGYFSHRTFMILSGVNRWEIARELGWETLEIQEVEVADREEFAIQENLARRHMTRAQKDLVITYLLRIDPRASNRTIAKRAGAHHSTVQARRSDLESGGEISHQRKRVGRDGKAQRVTRSGGEISHREKAALKAEIRDIKRQIRDLERLLVRKEKQLERV